MKKILFARTVDKVHASCTGRGLELKAICAHIMECGGVSAMHDATEGGVIGGLFEIANASGVGMKIDDVPLQIPKQDPFWPVFFESVKCGAI